MESSSIKRGKVALSKEKEESKGEDRKKNKE